ncbi:hypothetical protein EB796_024517 [Bugula neritina]|uniref:Ig-like domain-containing protein n=1 Tax=Bugula neritina TaxID=10212 RepID=A0A7J7IUF6_BUGNE|nr:hypothetical protein EB796_024517 [Bugula neritina]
MSAFTCIVLSLTVLQVFAQDGGIYSSSNFPSFYENEEGIFRCPFTLAQDEYNSLTGFGYLKVGDPATAAEGCLVSKAAGLTTVGTANLNVVSTEDCEAAYNDLGVSLTATIVLKSTLTEVGEYTCFWFNNANSFETGSKLEVDQLKVAPTQLDMTITPDMMMYSGDMLGVVCLSQGGSPASIFSYEKNGIALQGEPSYEVGPADDGSVFKCVDETHANYNGGQSNLTSQEKQITVFYLKSNKPELSHVSANPMRTELLDCTTDGNLPDGVTIMYSWMNNGTVVSTEPILEVSKTDVNETMSELYECTVSTTDSKLGTVMVGYNITWNVQTTTPAKPPSTMKPKPKPTTEKFVCGKANTGNSGSTTTIVISSVVVYILSFMFY